MAAHSTENMVPLRLHQVVHKQKECDMHMDAPGLGYISPSFVGSGWSILALATQLCLQNATLTMYRGFISGKKRGLD